MGLFGNGGLGSAIGGVVGGLLGGAGSVVSAGISAANAKAINQANYEHQKEFAQHGIRWKVADAKASGLHPLAALGAQTSSYTPSAVVGDSPDFSFLRDIGQDVGRAIDAKSTAAERAANKAKIDQGTNLELEGKKLDNEYKRTLIASQKQEDALRLANAAVRASWSQQLPPAMPSLAPDGSLMPGQENATSPGGIESKPAEIVVNEPGRRGQERGSITELGFSRTNDGGYVPVMSNDAKQRYEEDIFGEIGWNLRNRLPGLIDRQDVAPPRSWLSDPDSSWEFDLSRGAWYERPAGRSKRSYWIPGMR